MNKNDIRPIFKELQGYLSQAPTAKETSDCIYDAMTWEQINTAISELNTITQKNYDRFKIMPEPGRDVVRITGYRTRLGGLISRLYGEYFSDEPAPFSGSPSTIISQNQKQEQTTYITMLLEIQDKINDRLQKTTDEKEKSFLEQIKRGLGTVKTIAELILLLLSTAQTFGIPLSKLIEVFH